MPASQAKLKLPSFNRAALFLAAAGVVLAFNAYGAVKETAKLSKVRKRISYTFLGDRFAGLDRFIGQAPYVGYFTDKNLDDPNDSRPAMQFAQAQLVMAPTVLDLNNTSHEFIIFDCTSPQAAIKKISEIGASPLKANQFGIILAQRKNQTETHTPAKKRLEKLQGQRP